MTLEAIHTRQRLIQGLRDWADWLESDSTIPAPVNLYIGTLLPDVKTVQRLARIHDLGPAQYEPGAISRTYADARFGPVVHRLYANGRPQ
jgi:hypothetical protein